MDKSDHSLTFAKGKWKCFAIVWGNPSPGIKIKSALTSITTPSAKITILINSKLIFKNNCQMEEVFSKG